MLIVIRLWHLTVVEHEEKERLAARPQRKVVIEKADRSPIFDRFGEPLAINKIRYNASLCYGELREIPRSVWEKNSEGKKIKRFKRKEYIKELSLRLGDELSIDPGKLEDLIHARASLFGMIPFTLKENISAQEYYRLKMLEKDLPGLHAEISSNRTYPQGKSACDIVGYVGAMSRGEYEKHTCELKQLRTFLAKMEEGEPAELPPKYFSIEAIKRRVEEIESKAYRITDVVGKIGVEKSLEEKLRGCYGLKTYLTDTKGNFLQEIDTSRAKENGKEVDLTISLELQEYAEKLLVEYEQGRLGGDHRRVYFPEKQPWIKGGAAIVLDPNTGEVLAAASCPRFDPNDFVGKGGEIKRWIENESYLASIWDGKEALKREKIGKDGFYDETLELTHEVYLDMILPRVAPTRKALMKVSTLAESCQLQERARALLSYFGSISAPKVFDFLYGGKLTLQEKKSLQAVYEESKEAIDKAKADLSPFFEGIALNDDRLLLVDLCRVIVDSHRFTPELLEKIGDKTLADFRSDEVNFLKVEENLKKQYRNHFVENEFQAWREKEFKGYLAQKRATEKVEKPYLDYLEEAEELLFGEFWEKRKWPALLKALPDTSISYLKTFRSFHDRGRPLLGIYRSLRGMMGAQVEKDLAAAFYPKNGFGMCKSYCFGQAAPIGSIFKLVPSYEALRQRYIKYGDSIDLNPLVIVDDKHQRGEHWNVGFTHDGKVIPRSYRGGLLPRTSKSGVGRIDLIEALAASSNPYFALLAGDVLEDAEDLARAAALFSYGSRTGIDLPYEFAGKLPVDCSYNRTGLYSFAIGQHSLTGTPLQSAVMIAAIANGGKVLKPRVVLDKSQGPAIVRTLFMPPKIRNLLLKGMRETIEGEKGTARGLKNHFSQETLHGIVGKTSTAEAVEHISLDAKDGAIKLKHVAFGGIAFEKGLEKPELVVVVFLRFGEFGREESAEIAVKLIEKWREIKSRHHL